MARYNKLNNRIMLNQKSTDNGGIFNYRVVGIVGHIISSLTVTAIPHLRRSASATVTVVATFIGSANRTFHRSASIVISALTTAKATRGRHSVANSNITASFIGTAKRNMFARGVINLVLSFIARLRQMYRPVYPALSVTEYPIEMTVTGYEILLEVIGMPFAGSTITLRGTFPDSAGSLVELEDVTLKVYSPGRVLDETITPTEVSTGLYSGDYTIPDDLFGQFDFEFSGTLGDKTIMGRSSFDSNWK